MRAAARTPGGGATTSTACARGGSSRPISSVSIWSWRSTKPCPPELHHRSRRMAAYCGLPEGEGVPDPYDGGDADFERVLDLVEAGCRQLIAELGTEARPTSDRVRAGQESRSSL
jgi:hypothetical protein